MDPTTTATDPISRPKPNGILTRKHQPQHPIMRHHPQPHPSPPPSLYKECLKNHAASLGGHAVDGCGEFMPSPSSNPSDPSSLTCAACGCHRNFHRRTRILLYDYDMEDSGGGGGDNSSQNDDTDDGGGGEVDRRHHSTSPSPPSAPHMLLALSTGAGLSPAAAAGPAAGVTLTTAQTPTPTVGVGVGVGVDVEGILSRKRFRSKFSPEQKERMQELSERLGWRMQKRDEGILEETCREIGVGKGVFKVWMHNNKHNFVLKNTTNNNNNNASSSSVNVSASAAGELGLGGEGLVHHLHHNNGVNGSADSSF